MNRVEVRVRTPVVMKHRELRGHLDFLDANTHLISKTGPPDNNKNPDFVKDRDVSVLRSPRDGQRTLT